MGLVAFWLPPEFRWNRPQIYAQIPGTFIVSNAYYDVFGERRFVGFDMDSDGWPVYGTSPTVPTFIGNKFPWGFPTVPYLPPW